MKQTGLKKDNMGTIHNVKKKTSTIRFLMKRLKIDEETKEEIVYDLTNGRTSHVSELFENESTALLKRLMNETGMDKSPAVKMRRKIISMAHEMRWEYNGGQINMEKINEWCIKFGYLHKELNKYTEQELPALVTQFEQVYHSYLKGI